VGIAKQVYLPTRETELLTGFNNMNLKLVEVAIDLGRA
jgi:hypothetical protein